MKKEIAEQWTKALRSGDYKQGTGALKMNDCYCCLGVLCEISNLSSFKDNDNGVDECEYFSCCLVLPIEVMGWAGIRNDTGSFWGRDGGPCINLNGYPSLADANDKGVSFSQIADYIDANYQNL